MGLIWPQSTNFGIFYMLLIHLVIVSFENFVKSMPPNLSELKVTPSFCFPFKIPDDLTATSKYLYDSSILGKSPKGSKSFRPRFFTWTNSILIH